MSSPERADTIPLTDVTPTYYSAALKDHGKLYTRLVQGRFQRLRRWVSLPLILLFMVAVWLPWGDRPALLFSLAEHRIFIFGLTLSWQDLPLLAAVLILAALLLFVVAVVWGRIWCGFACPQSIWTWLFIRIEHLLEGNDRQRQRMDTLGMTSNQRLRRVSKHLLWGLVALITAITFTGYFVPIRELLQQVLTLNLSAAWVWVLIMASLTYLNAGLIRDNICNFACPYSRFQSAMFDENTRTVSYDLHRGEPRGHRHEKTAGDCVDCTLCVQVCPVGIDIRDGLQHACIDCGACIDACDQVMDQLARPRGLIRFASENELSKQPSPKWRPRLLGYLTAVTLTTSALAYGYTQRPQLLLEVERERGRLYVQLPDESFCNDVQVKLESVEAASGPVHLSIEADPKHRQVPLPFTLRGTNPINLNERESNAQKVRICTTGPIHQSIPITVTARMGDASAQKSLNFIVGFRS